MDGAREYWSWPSRACDRRRLREKEAQTLAVLAGLRNNQLDRSGVKANRHVIVVPEIDIDGDDAGGVERIFAENFFACSARP